MRANTFRFVVRGTTSVYFRLTPETSTGTNIPLRCNVRTRCKILSLRPFPAPSAAHLPAPHCGPLPPCRALFARADGFTSASTVSLFAFMLARALCDVKSFFKITAFPQKSKRGTGRLAGGPCVGQSRAALLFLAKYKT